MERQLTPGMEHATFPLEAGVFHALATPVVAAAMPSVAAGEAVAPSVAAGEAADVVSARSASSSAAGGEAAARVVSTRSASSAAAPAAGRDARSYAGRPLLFLHGFPDHPPTGVPLFVALAARGHRVLAPWLRGYAPSPIDGPFDLDTLVGDLVGLIERWSPGEPVDVVGHDWGAVLTYALCNAAPARVARAVTLAVPHPLTFLRQLRSPAQLRASWYMGLFQLPGSERIVRARDYRLIDRLWRRWSPGLQLTADQRRDLHACLDASKLAPLEYYRAARRTSRAQLRRAAQPITTPLLALHGEHDGCILPPTVDDRKRFAGPYEREIVPGVGHFMHIESPDAIADRISGWLQG